MTASSGSRSAVVADAIARIVQAIGAQLGDANTTPSAPPNSNAASILTSAILRDAQQLLSTPSAQAASTPAASASAPTPTTSATTTNTTTTQSTLMQAIATLIVSNGAAGMELNLNQLLNGAALQKTLTLLPPELLARPQVIQALVLQNTLLPAAPSSQPQNLPLLTLPSTTTVANANAGATPTLYRVNIEWQNRLIQLLSPQPLPTGTRVPLQIDARGNIELLRPEIAAKLLAAQNVAASSNTPSAPIAPPPSPAMQAIQQSLRELLPRQQALHTLVPLLQKFIAPQVRAQLPAPIFKGLAQLLQSLPKPTQLNTAENVKQAIANSGSFLEAKLTQTAAAAPGAEPAAKIVATDMKAQISALLTLIRQFAPHANANKPATNQAATPFVAEDDFVYTKPTQQPMGGGPVTIEDNESLDSLLSQLSKLLQSGFARVQLNQLDSASARHVNHDNQTPVPTWVLELPLRTPHGVDQLQLRIEQQRKQQQQRQQVQWNVEIAFDLHSAGKIAALLAIADNSVSATLWAEQEKTHQRVREEMAYLRAGLESVGVKVKDMQCRLGLPPARTQAVSQQLVDIHT